MSPQSPSRVAGVNVGADAQHRVRGGARSQRRRVVTMQKKCGIPTATGPCRNGVLCPVHPGKQENAESLWPPALRPAE